MSELTKKEVDSATSKDIALAALEIVIDGVASSEATQISKQAGAYIAGLIIADMKGLVDAETKKAILSIISMAAEVAD